jgi:hypothetical protein
MLPLIFIVVLSIQIYRTARDNGYNAPMWTAVTAVGFFVIQFVVGLAIGVILLLGASFSDWSPTLLDDYQFFVGLAAMIPAFIFVWLIWRHVNVIRDDGMAPEPPPPPPTFNDDQSRPLD